MAINKNFVVKNGLEVSTELIFADADTRRVGIQNTQPQHTLHVVGGIGATNLTVSGVSTFSKPVGFGSDVNIVGISTITGHVSIGKTTLLVVGDLDVTGNIKGGGVLNNITNLNVSGIGTVNEIYAAGGNVSVGFLTATSAADISGNANLTGITTITNLQAGLATEFFAATGIQSGGVPIGGGVTTINFTGIGATLVEVFGTRADVYISGGPGISSVGIETSGAFVGTATTLNFIGPGVTVGVSSDNVAHVTVGLGSLGYTFRSFVSIGSPQITFPFQYNRNAIEAYSNGIKLVQGSDYTATNGTTVSLASTARVGDTVEFVSYQAEIVSPLPGQVLRRQYTAGAGQTSFQFVGGYDIGNLDVFLNGSKLVESSDFTATDGLSFNVIGGSRAGDVLEAMTYPANIVGAGGSNFLFMDNNVPIGLASTINLGFGISVTGYDSKVGIVTIGTNLPDARTDQSFTATEGQSIFNFAYNVGSLDVFVNGVKLATSEFTATDGTTVTLDVSRFAGDIVELVSYNTVTISSGGDVGIITATGGFISAANTTPIQISLVGNELTFTASGIGSTTLTLS